MRRIFFSLLLISLLFASCNKFLDTTPNGIQGAATYYSTIYELNAALNGTYNTIDGIWNGKMTGYDQAADELLLNITNPSTTGPNVYNYTPSDGNIKSLWGSLYFGINCANNILANLNNFPVNDTTKNIRGQALFLRAFYYSILVEDFGNVPIRNTPTISVLTQNFPACTPDSVYRFIVNDMMAADSLVKPITYYADNQHVTKSAVEAILARVYLTWAGYPLFGLDNGKFDAVGKYDSCINWGYRVVNNNLHRLNPDYKQIFINEIQDKQDKIYNEVIWETAYSGNYTISPTVAFTNGVFLSFGLDGLSNNTYRVSPKLYEAFDPLIDLRKDWVAGNYAASSTTTKTTQFFLPTVGTFSYANSNNSHYFRCAAKWRRDYSTDIPVGGNNAPTNFPIIRYADVLLMIAEAENEVNNNPTPDAINLVNAVRERAYGTGYRVTGFSITNRGSGYPVTTTSSNASATTVTCDPGSSITTAINNPATFAVATSNGKISQLYLTSSGAFYNSAVPPQINFMSVGGTGATAVGVLKQIVPSDADLTATQTASYLAFKQAIVDERMKELCYESFRRNDLVRWTTVGDGNPFGLVTVLHNLGNKITTSLPLIMAGYAVTCNNASPKYLLFPIPTSELTLNKALKQNPGY